MTFTTDQKDAVRRLLASDRIRYNLEIGQVIAPFDVETIISMIKSCL